MIINHDPYYIDTETCGFHGVVVLIQYALGDGEIKLFSPWESPVCESIELIEKFANHPGGVIGFNWTFDWFHLYKWWTICKLLEEIDPEYYPEDHIDLIVELEEKARDYPLCLKPVSCLDLFLHARKGPYQSTMDRKNIRIRKVPSQLAWIVAEELEKRVPLRNIYFARRKDKYQKKWQIVDRKDTFGEIENDWKDIVVRFKPSSALKNLAVDALGISEHDILKFGDISPKVNPVEFGYAPYVKAAMRIRLKNKTKQRKREGYKYSRTWPDMIKNHIIHWGHNELAREYARNDIVYTRALRLHKDFINAQMDDDDSVLACMVGAARWRGYKVDLDGIKALKEKALNKKFIVINNQKTLLPTAPNDVKRYMMDACDDTEKLAIQQGDTKKITLEELYRDWNLPCPECKLNDLPSRNCTRCKGKGSIKHKAAERAYQILDARRAGKEIELYDKLLAADRLHASVKVIGSLSGRMSGTDGLNPLAIKKTKEVKSKFLFAWDNEILAGGDFDAFEVTIAVRVYNDDNLRKDLLTCEKCEGEMIFDQKSIQYVCTQCRGTKGKKIHALFGTYLFPPMTYEDIKATDGSADDIYTRCKSGVFTLIYMGGPHSLCKKLGVLLADAEEGERRFKRKYKGIEREQEQVKYDFGPLSQPNGRGTKVEWHDPKEKVETLYGFPRWFTLENRIIKALYDLANKMPPNLKNMKLKVTRTDRIQTAGGATCSAIYSAAFGTQGHCIRAAGNHVIQGTGAQITKKVQRRIWDIQPKGVFKWLVQPLNIHDSIMTPMKPEVVDEVTKVVRDTVEEIRPVVPLIKLPWAINLENWADRGEKPKTKAG